MEDLPIPSTAEGPTSDQETLPEPVTTPVRTEPAAPTPLAGEPPPPAPVPRPEVAPPPPKRVPPTPPLSPPSPPPPTVAFGRGPGVPTPTPAKVRRLLSSLFIVFIVIIVGFLGFIILRKTILRPRREITLTYWGLWEDPDIISPLLSDFITTYTEKHSDVTLTINYEKRTFGTLEQLKTTLLTRLQRGTGPNLCRLHNSWVKEFADELAPLPSEVMSESDYTSAFYPVALSSAKVGEQIFAIPLEYDGIVLYYNKKLFEGVDAPSALSTWEGFRREAVRLTQWEENDPTKKILRAGAAFGAVGNISHSADLFSLLLSQSGADPLTELETQAVADALSFYTNFVTVNHVWDETLPFSIDAFANEQVAMVFGPSWRALNISDRNPQLDFAAVPVPQLPAAPEKGVHWASFWMEAVSKDSANTELAWELLKFLSEEEQQRKFYSTASQVRAFGEPYSRSSLAENLSTHEILEPLLASASGAVSSKTVDFSGNKAYVDALKQAIADVLAGKSASEALKTAQATINQLEGK